MNSDGQSALVIKSPTGLEKAQLGANRIISGMVTDALALARNGKVDAEASYQHGLKFYKNKEYLFAAKAFREAAMLGHPAAQYHYGDMLSWGLRIEQDMPEGIKWLEKSAEQGHMKSQFELGEIFYCYPDVAKSATQGQLAKSAMWYRKAAEQGHSFSQNHLAEMYQKGMGVPMDDVEAVKWHRQAAEQGNFKSQLELSTLYHQGLGVPQNDSESERWYQLANESFPKEVKVRKFLGWSRELGWSKELIK